MCLCTGGARKDVVVKQLNNGLRSMDLVAPCLLPEIWQVGLHEMVDTSVSDTTHDYQKASSFKQAKTGP